MSKTRQGARAAADVRICRLHDLVVRDASGHSRAFRVGERVEMTPALLEALGDYADRFERLDDAQVDPNAPPMPTTTTASSPTVTLPAPETVTALGDSAHEE